MGHSGYPHTVSDDRNIEGEVWMDAIRFGSRFQFKFINPPGEDQGAGSCTLANNRLAVQSKVIHAVIEALQEAKVDHYSTFAYAQWVKVAAPPNMRLTDTKAEVFAVPDFDVVVMTNTKAGDDAARGRELDAIRKALGR